MNKKENVINEKSINDINYELLKKQFPNAISIDENGKYSIDPNKLQMSLDPSKANIKEDGYGLNWVGKKEAYHNAFSKNYKVLKPLNDENSKNWDSTGNILIKGDNIDALKILRQNYFEAIKMIYIDPPYNTKNDGFIYNDNFTSSKTQTLEELGYDEDYVEYIENIQGAKTHSGWLSFMYPRLLLARDLLKDDGVMFISIDNNEITQLKLLCDEIFGENNVEQYIWNLSDFEESSFTKTASHTVRVEHEYIIACYKTSKKLGRYKEYRLKDRDDLSNIDNDPRGEWFSGNISRNGIKSTTGSQYYTVTTPKGIDYTRNWTIPKEEFNELVKDNRIYFSKGGEGVPRLKIFKNEPSYSIQNSIFTGVKTSITGKNQLKELFNGKVFFDFPKPINLISRLITLATNNSDIVLDFFAGSGTTAHAVMDLNSQDNGDRKFICVQWAEKTPEKSEAKKAGYNTIFDITQERIKRAGEKIIKDDITKQDLDIGFRTFEIVEDLKQKIYQKPLGDVTQDDLSIFNTNLVETSEEILYNLFVADSLPLSTKIEELIKDKLYLASNVAFVLGNIAINYLIDKLKTKKDLEYITIYSPNISDDKFTLELESAVGSIGIKTDKIKFRG